MAGIKNLVSKLFGADTNNNVQPKKINIISGKPFEDDAALVHPEDAGVHTQPKTEVAQPKTEVAPQKTGQLGTAVPIADGDSLPGHISDVQEVEGPNFVEKTGGKK